MSNILINWWRSQQFKLALRRGDTQSAIRILQKIQKSGARLSWLEKLFRDKLKLERNYLESKRENANLIKQISEIKVSRNNLLLQPNPELIREIYRDFKIKQHDESKLQITGINQLVFDNFELGLVAYLQQELTKIPAQKLAIKLQDAFDDLNNLKAGQDPNYGFSLTPHVYFMKYFLENVYCLYLAWFLIYQDGLLPGKLNILDIAAGPGTTACSLALFLQSCRDFLNLSQTHISYYSLEEQDIFQYRGLQFWRKYVESQIKFINTYFRFVTADIFSYNSNSYDIPRSFFDFIVISHCFFADKSKRFDAMNIYKQMVENCLNSDGYVLLIIQDKKLFRAYNTPRSENIEQEKNVINQLLEELELDLVWYKYLTSTGLRETLNRGKFTEFAKDKLPKQLYLSPLLKQYFSQHYESSYTLDDYVILAQKSAK
ncbi:MAG: photosystem II assembly protein [Sphaerospermopsis sp. SIO1G2]|nr:photosystem II assembly protein [Sphaerospermopsis sp. SIO1G2]